MNRWLTLCLAAGIFILSCQKESTPNGTDRLFLSADSLQFDTLFTNTGSVTQKVRLINNNSRSISVSDIRLMGGAASAFTINIDGNPGPVASNLSIAGNDSLYIFVNLFIRPGADPKPFLISDSIRISYNGVEQYIQLSAWGQNAHFLTGAVIRKDTVWTNDLPFVIYGGLRVDSNITLTLQTGTRVYLHADAPFYVDGTLQVMGGPADSQQVVFTGDRLDKPYAGYPGSWPGIYFSAASRDNKLNYLSVQNAYRGIVTEGPGVLPNPKILMTQCSISNALSEGMLCVKSSVHAVNCLISNCGQNIVIGGGGSYQFEQCTVASYSTIYFPHQFPVLSASNSGMVGNQQISGDLNAKFLNCIFWGSEGINNEAELINQPGTGFSVSMGHCILKQQDYPADLDSSFLFLNQDPFFMNTGRPPERVFDFHLLALSPGVNAGADLGISIDLDDNPRPVDQPDLGCYERQ